MVLSKTKSRSVVGVLALATISASSIAAAETHADHQGEAVYAQSCLACHGPDGAGAMPGIPDLTEMNGPLSKSDKVLMKSILEGIETESTPIPMPAKGGDEHLTEAKARLVLEYIRREFRK